MELERIYHPVSGEEGFFLPKKEAKIVKTILADFRFSKLASIECETVAGDVNE